MIEFDSDNIRMAFFQGGKLHVFFQVNYYTYDVDKKIVDKLIATKKTDRGKFFYKHIRDLPFKKIY